MINISITESETVTGQHGVWPLVTMYQYIMKICEEGHRFLLTGNPI